MTASDHTLKLFRNLLHQWGASIHAVNAIKGAASNRDRSKPLAQTRGKEYEICTQALVLRKGLRVVHR
jgi:hypothetical protein